MQKTNLLIAAATALVVISGGTSVALLRQNAILRQNVLALRMETQVTMNVPLSELKGTGFSGEPLTLTLQKTHLTKAQPTVLFVLSPECKFCAANWVNWHSLLKDSGAKSRWQPVFLDVGPLVNADYLQRHEIDKSTLFQTVSGDTKLNFRLYSTPETIIVDKTGRARGVWRGTLNAKQMTEIRTLLSQL